MHYYLKDYQTALQYYERYLKMKALYKMDLYSTEDLKIAIVLDKLGQHGRAAEFAQRFREHAEKHTTMYKHLLIGSYYAYKKENKKALEHLKLFSNENDFQYWILLMDTEPLFENIKDDPEFKQVMRVINKKFQDTHEELKFMLEQSSLP
ncbi:MAG TPA: hypothetical protein VEB86_18765 [Chryseosolibacter sp.]|nr:hypothetical protein [Chryseosolibacter sp.]